MSRIKIIMVFVCFLFASSLMAAEVEVNWEGNIEPNLAGYKLYQGVNKSGEYTKVFDIPCEQIGCENFIEEYTLTALEDGTYFWVLTAYNEVGKESSYSNEISLTINTAPPGAPTGFMVKIKSVGHVEVSTKDDDLHTSDQLWDKVE